MALACTVEYEKERDDGTLGICVALAPAAQGAIIVRISKYNY